jgi:hypothetical protein
MDERKTVVYTRRLLLPIALLCLVGLPQAWSQSPTLQGIISDVNSDTLLTTLRVLTGETGSTNIGQSDTIVSRGYKMPGKALAAAFLEHRLAELGLRVMRDSFQFAFAPISGTNILAEQTGTRFPLQKYILCAHYDATADDTRDSVAPGADDNATGVAAVLEAARLLSRYQTDYTILFALWDCEELGCIGSDAYATAARTRGDSIIGVINLDMLGTDTNSDSLMKVGGGTAIDDTVVQLCQLYQIGLMPVIVSSGLQSSDHVSFRRQKYPAIMLIEYHFTISPVNHTSLDRIDRLNLDYFRRQTKLAVATIAFLAGVNSPCSVTAAKNVATTFSLEQNYPNPFNPVTQIKYSILKDGYVTLKVFDVLGREVTVLVNGLKRAGVYTLEWNAGNFASGVYLARLIVRDDLGNLKYHGVRKLLLAK